MRQLLFFVLLLSLLASPNFAVSSAFINTNANGIKHYKDFIASNRKIIRVSDNYTRIQDAINSANEGDTILVSSGTYYERIVLHKSVNLIGQDALTTILDGQGTGTVVTVTANNATIDGFTIKNGEIGIQLNSVGNSLIRRNKVNNNQDGIDITSSWNSTITENNSSNNNQRGIYLEFSWNCNVEGNIIEKNGWYGLNLFYSRNSSIVGNIVRGTQYDNDAIGLDYSRDSVVVGNTANDSIRGVWLENSTNIVVEGNYVNNNWYGISIDNSAQNVVKQNDVRNSRGFSLGLYFSTMNIFYHNNFVATIAKQVESKNSVNILDNNLEGNYWSDYNGTDHDNDGIGDTAYIIDADERDNYPLMGRFSNFPINREGKIHNVEALSNSTISNFEFNADKNEIRFKVSGENNTYGFCRISIPKVLMNGTLIVRVDGNAPITNKKLEHPNLAFNYLYFTYVHSMRQVTIALETLQEFSLLQLLMPLLIALVALLAASILILVAKRKKLHLHMRRKNE